MHTSEIEWLVGEYTFQICVEHVIGGRAEGYHQKVDLAFRQIAAEESDRVRIVDASGEPEQVTERLLGEIADLLP